MTSLKGDQSLRDLRNDFRQVIADLDNDGVDEMVIAASFFYDHE